jgi:prepilin-type N-terminal cleavage/methylation domain-containing protein
MSILYGIIAIKNKGDRMKKSGFTLIELIFVIVIIGLLASVAVPKFLATKKNAETANIPEVAKQIVNKAEETYQFTGSHDLQKIIDNDRDLKKYSDDLNAKTDWSVDKNSTEYNITYGTNNHVCLRVNVVTKEVNVSSSATVKGYDFNITDLNTSCNTD